MKRARTRLLRLLGAEAGRTMIEVLTATAVAGVVTLMLASIVILGLRFARTSQFEHQRVYPVRNGFDMIVKEVRLAESVLEDCGATGRLAITMHGPAENEGWVVHYRLAPDGRLVRAIYGDASCSSLLSEQPLAYQIDAFSIDYLDDGRFDIRIAARSEDGTAFELQQIVTGRVLGQP